MGNKSYDDWAPGHIEKKLEALEKENESLRDKLADSLKLIREFQIQINNLLDYIDKQDLKNAQDVVDERDELERRAKLMYQWMNKSRTYGDYPIWDLFLSDNKAKSNRIDPISWFEEEK